jgi:hypothetical protein
MSNHYLLWQEAMWVNGKFVVILDFPTDVTLWVVDQPAGKPLPSIMSCLFPAGVCALEAQGRVKIE